MHAHTSHWLLRSYWILHARPFLQLSSCMYVLMSYYVKNKLSTFKHKRATYLLSMSEHSSSQCNKWGKGENMWWLLNNTHSFTFIIKDHACRHKSLGASCWILHVMWFLQLLSFVMCVLVSYYVKIKLSTLAHKRAAYLLSMSEHSSSQCSKWRKGENMWWLLNNTHSFTLAALKIMHADTSHWVPAVEFYMSGDFYNCLPSCVC